MICSLSQKRNAGRREALTPPRPAFCLFVCEVEPLRRKVGVVHDVQPIGGSAGQRPKQVDDIKRVFDRRTETNDGQRTDHADERHAEGRRVEHAVEGFLIDEKDEQAKYKRDHQCKCGVQQRKRLYAVQKLDLRYLERTLEWTLYVDFLVYYAADRVLGKGGSAEVAQNL